MLTSAPLERALERDAWRYWSGAGWSPDAASASELFHGAPIMSVHFNAYLGAYVAVYSAPLSDDVVLRTAPSLSGPWSEPLRRSRPITALATGLRMTLRLTPRTPRTAAA